VADKPLTYKQFERLMFIKLNALREMSKLLGMTGPLRKISDSLGHKVEYDVNEVLIITYLYLYADLPLYSKYALASLLDYYIPEWREVIGMEHLGPIVGRNAKEVAMWKKKILERDENKCQLCGSDEYLEVHHKIPWAEAPEYRLHVDNGIVLCVDCHANQHEKLHNLIMSKKVGDGGG